MNTDRLRERIRPRRESLIRIGGLTRPGPTPTGPDDTCPACGSRQVAWIVYGVVDWTSELHEALMSGEVVLGGCMVFGDDPDRACNDCRHRWRFVSRPRRRLLVAE